MSPAAVILAAGEGTRMRPLTANTPKPLLPVGGKPFLEHTLEALAGVGVKQVVVIIGWRARRVKEVFGHGERWGLQVEYVEQPERSGTAAAVGLAEGRVKGRFLCINGDVIVAQEDLRGLAASGGPTMALARVEHPENLGVVTVQGERVLEIEEKPAVARGNLANAGVYLFDQDIFDFIRATPMSPRGEFEITDSLRLLTAKEELRGLALKGPWLSVEYPWDLLRANEILLQDLRPEVLGKVEPGATLRGPVSVGEGAILRDGAYVLGPCIIGREAEIGPNCYLRPSTTLGDHTKVGNGCEVKNSIVMAETHIPHQNYVGDSILGERCNLGAGTKVANLRLDEKPIRVVIKGREVDTGLRKLGVIMGDDVKTGINASLDVGCVVGENSFIGPGAVVRGNLAPRSRVY